MSDGANGDSAAALLLGVPDAAKALGVGATKCWELIRTGRLPSVYLDRRRLVPAEALQRFVAELIGNQANEDAAAGAVGAGK